MSDGEMNENDPSPLVRRMSIRRNRRPTQRIAMPVDQVVRQGVANFEPMIAPPPPSPNPPVNMNIHRMVRAFDVDPLLPPLEMPEYLRNARPNMGRPENRYPARQFAEDRVALIEEEDEAEDEAMNIVDEEHNEDAYRVEFHIPPIEYRGFFRNLPFRGPDRRGVVLAGQRAANNLQARFIRHPRVHNNARRGQASVGTQTEPRNRNAVNNFGRNNAAPNQAGASGSLVRNLPDVSEEERMEEGSEQ